MDLILGSVVFKVLFVYLLMFAILVVWGISFYSFVDISEKDLRSYGHLIQLNDDNQQYLSRRKRDSVSKLNDTNSDSKLKGRQNESISQSQTKSTPVNESSFKLTTLLTTVAIGIDKNASNQKEVTSTKIVLTSVKNQHFTPTTEKSIFGSISTIKSTANVFNSVTNKKLMKKVTSSSLISATQSTEKKGTEIPLKNKMATTNSEFSKKFIKNDELASPINSELTTLPNSKKTNSFSSDEPSNGQTTQNKNDIPAKSSTILGTPTTFNLLSKITTIATTTTPNTKEESSKENIKSTTNIKSSTSTTLGNDVTNAVTVTNSKTKLTINSENFETKNGLTLKSTTKDSKFLNELSNFNEKQSTTPEKLNKNLSTNINLHTIPISSNLVTMVIPASNKAMSSLLDTPKSMTTLAYILTTEKIATRKEIKIIAQTVSPRLLALNDSDSLSTMNNHKMSNKTSTQNTSRPTQKTSFNTFTSKVFQIPTSNVISLTTRKSIIGMSQVSNLSSPYSSMLMTSPTIAKQLSYASIKPPAPSQSSKTSSVATSRSFETTTAPNSAASTSSILQSVTKTINSLANVIYNSIISFKFNSSPTLQMTEKTNFTLKQPEFALHKTAITLKNEETLIELNQTVSNGRYKRQANFPSQELENNVSKESKTTNLAFDSEAFTTTSDSNANTTILNDNENNYITNGNTNAAVVKAINLNLNSSTDQDTIAGDSNANIIAFNNNKINSIKRENSEITGHSVKEIVINSSSYVTYSDSLSDNDEPEKQIFSEANFNRSILNFTNSNHNSIKSDIVNIAETDKSRVSYLIEEPSSITTPNSNVLTSKNNVENDRSNDLETNLTNTSFKDDKINSTISQINPAILEINIDRNEHSGIQADKIININSSTTKQIPTIVSLSFSTNNITKKLDSTSSDISKSELDNKNIIEHFFETDGSSVGSLTEELFTIATSVSNSLTRDNDDKFNDVKSDVSKLNNSLFNGDKINFTLSRKHSELFEISNGSNEYSNEMQLDKITSSSAMVPNSTTATNLFSSFSTSSEAKELDSTYLESNSVISKINDSKNNFQISNETVGLNVNIKSVEVSTVTTPNLNSLTKKTDNVKKESTNEWLPSVQQNKVDSIYTNNTSFKNDKINYTISKDKLEISEIKNDDNEYFREMQTDKTMNGSAIKQNNTIATDLVSSYSMNNEAKKLDFINLDSIKSEFDDKNNVTNLIETAGSRVSSLPEEASSVATSVSNLLTSVNNDDMSNDVKIDANKLNNSSFSGDKINSSRKHPEMAENNNGNNEHSSEMQLNKTATSTAIMPNSTIATNLFLSFSAGSEAKELDYINLESKSVTEINGKGNDFQNSNITAVSTVSVTLEVSTSSTSTLNSLTEKTDNEKKESTNEWASSVQQNKADSIHTNNTSLNNAKRNSTLSKEKLEIYETNNGDNEYFRGMQTDKTINGSATKQNNTFAANVVSSNSTNSRGKELNSTTLDSINSELDDKNNVINLIKATELRVSFFSEAYSAVPTSVSNSLTRNDDNDDDKSNDVKIYLNNSSIKDEQINFISSKLNTTIFENSIDGNENFSRIQADKTTVNFAKEKTYTVLNLQSTKSDDEDKSTDIPIVSTIQNKINLTSFNQDLEKGEQVDSGIDQRSQSDVQYVYYSTNVADDFKNQTSLSMVQLDILVSTTYKPNEVIESNNNETSLKNFSTSQTFPKLNTGTGINKKNNSDTMVDEVLKGDESTISTKLKTEISMLAKVNQNQPESTVLLIPDSAVTFNPMTSPKMTPQAVMDNNESLILLTSISTQNSSSMQNASTLSTFTNDKDMNMSSYVTSSSLQTLINLKQEILQSNKAFETSETSFDVMQDDSTNPIAEVQKSTGNQERPTANPLSEINATTNNTQATTSRTNFEPFTSILLPGELSTANLDSKISTPNITLHAQSNETSKISSEKKSSEQENIPETSIKNDWDITTKTINFSIQFDNQNITSEVLTFATNGATIGSSIEGTAHSVNNNKNSSHSIIAVSAENKISTIMTEGVSMSAADTNQPSTDKLKMTSTAINFLNTSENSNLSSNNTSTINLNSNTTLVDLQTKVFVKTSYEENFFNQTTNDVVASTTATLHFSNKSKSYIVDHLENANLSIQNSSNFSLMNNFTFTANDNKESNVSMIKIVGITDHNDVTQSTMSTTYQGKKNSEATVEEIPDIASNLTKSTVAIFNTFNPILLPDDSSKWSTKELFQNSNATTNLIDDITSITENPKIASPIDLTTNELLNHFSNANVITSSTVAAQISKYSIESETQIMGTFNGTKESSFKTFTMSDMLSKNNFTDFTETATDRTLTKVTILSPFKAIENSTQSTFVISTEENFEKTFMKSSEDALQTTEATHIANSSNDLLISTIALLEKSNLSASDKGKMNNQTDSFLITTKTLPSKHLIFTSTIADTSDTSSGSDKSTEITKPYSSKSENQINHSKSQGSLSDTSTKSSSSDFTTPGSLLITTNNNSSDKTEISYKKTSTSTSNDVHNSSQSAVFKAFDSTTTAGESFETLKITNSTAESYNLTITNDLKLTTRTFKDTSFSNSVDINNANKSIASTKISLENTPTDSNTVTNLLTPNLTSTVSVSNNMETFTQSIAFGRNSTTTATEISAGTTQITKSMSEENNITLANGFESTTTTVGNPSSSGSSNVKNILIETSKMPKSTAVPYYETVSKGFESTTTTIKNLSLSNSSTVKEISIETSATFTQPTTNPYNLAVSEHFKSTATVVDLSTSNITIAKNASIETSKITKSTANPYDKTNIESFESTTTPFENIHLSNSLTVKNRSIETSKITESTANPYDITYIEGLESTTTTVENLSTSSSTTVKNTSIGTTKVAKSTAKPYNITNIEDFESKTTTVGDPNSSDSAAMNKEISIGTSKMTKSTANPYYKTVSEGFTSTATTNNINNTSKYLDLSTSSMETFPTIAVSKTNLLNANLTSSVTTSGYVGNSSQSTISTFESSSSVTVQDTSIEITKMSKSIITELNNINVSKGFESTTTVFEDVSYSLDSNKAITKLLNYNITPTDLSHIEYDSTAAEEQTTLLILPTKIKNTTISILLNTTSTTIASSTENKLDLPTSNQSFLSSVGQNGNYSSAVEISPTSAITASDYAPITTRPTDQDTSSIFSFSPSTIIPRHLNWIVCSPLEKFCLKSGKCVKKTPTDIDYYSKRECERDPNCIQNKITCKEPEIQKTNVCSQNQIYCLESGSCISCPKHMDHLAEFANPFITDSPIEPQLEMASLSCPANYIVYPLPVSVTCLQDSNCPFKSSCCKSFDKKATCVWLINPNSSICPEYFYYCESSKQCQLLTLPCKGKCSNSWIFCPMLNRCALNDTCLNETENKEFGFPFTLPNKLTPELNIEEFSTYLEDKPIIINAKDKFDIKGLTDYTMEMKEEYLLRYFNEYIKWNLTSSEYLKWEKTFSAFLSVKLPIIEVQSIFTSSGVPATQKPDVFTYFPCIDSDVVLSIVNQNNSKSTYCNGDEPLLFKLRNILELRSKPNFNGNITIVVQPKIIDIKNTHFAGSRKHFTVNIQPVEDVPNINWRIAELDFDIMGVTKVKKSSLTEGWLVQNIVSAFFNDPDGNELGMALVTAQLSPLGNWQYQTETNEWKNIEEIDPNCKLIDMLKIDLNHQGLVNIDGKDEIDASRIRRSIKFSSDTTKISNTNTTTTNVVLDSLKNLTHGEFSSYFSSDYLSISDTNLFALHKNQLKFYNVNNTTELDLDLSWRHRKPNSPILPCDGRDIFTGPNALKLKPISYDFPDPVIRNNDLKADIRPDLFSNNQNIDVQFQSGFEAYIKSLTTTTTTTTTTMTISNARDQTSTIPNLSLDGSLPTNTNLGTIFQYQSSENQLSAATITRNPSENMIKPSDVPNNIENLIMPIGTSAFPKSSSTEHSDSMSTITSGYINDQKTSFGHKNDPPTRPAWKNTNAPVSAIHSSSSTIFPNINNNPTSQATTNVNAADDPKSRSPRVVPSNDTNSADNHKQADGANNHSSSRPIVNLISQVTPTRNPEKSQTSTSEINDNTKKNISSDLQFNATITKTIMTTASTTIATTTTVKPLIAEEEEKFHELITLRETVILFLPPKARLRFFSRNISADNQTWWSLTDAMQYSKLMFAAWDSRNSNISTAIKETIDIQLCSKQNKSCMAFNESITPQLAVYHLRIVDSSSGASLLEPRGQDICGVCGGNNDTCLDCNGVANGSSFMECGKCVKNSSECTNLTAKYFEYKEPTIKYCLLNVNTSYIDECGTCQPNKTSKSPQLCGKCNSLIDNSVPKNQFNQFYCNDTWKRDRMIEAVGFGPQPHQRWHRISGSQPVVFLDLCSFHGSSIYLHLYGPSWSYQTESFTKGECDLINARAEIKGHMTADIKEDRVQVKLMGLTKVTDHRMVCRLTTAYDETYTLSPFAKLSVIDSKNIKIENIIPSKIFANQNITIKVQGYKFINTSELACFYMRHPARQAFRLSSAKFVNENLVECKVESNTFVEGMTVDVGVVYSHASILQYNIRHSYLISSAMMDVIGQGPILNHLELSNDLTSVIAKFSCNVAVLGNCANIFQYMGGFGKNITCSTKSNEITISPIEDLYQIRNSYRTLSTSNTISCVNDVSIQATAGQTTLVSDFLMKPLSFDIWGPSQICFGYAFFKITLLDGNWFDSYQIKWTLQPADIVLNNAENKKLLQVTEVTNLFKSILNLKIDVNQLLPEIQYNLSATISNSKVTVVKTVQLVNKPSLKIIANIFGYSTIDPQYDLYLEANVSICPAYLNEERPRLSYYWEIDGSCSSLDHNRGRILKLYKGSLEGGRRYVVRCFVIANGDPKTFATAEFVLNTLIDKPMVIIPVKNVSFTLGQPINLNGKDSYDPYRTSNNLKYNWSCMTIDGEDCICFNMTPKVDLHSKINRMRPILNFSGHLLSVGNYIFELVITTPDGRNASDIVYVSVTPGSEKTPAINVVKGSRTVTMEDAVDLRAYIIGPGGTEIIWKPSRNPGFAYFDFFISHSTDWAGTIATEKPTQIPLTTSIAANTLQADFQYKFQLTASHSLEGQTWAEIIIKTNSKPYFNISNVSPTEGDAIFSKFTVCITDPWMKDKGISIRVGYKAYGTSRYLRQLVGPSTCLNDLRFPAVASPRGYLSVLVEACDSNSVCIVAESTSHIRVKVPSLDTEEKMKDFRNTLSEYIDQGDFNAAIAHAFSCIQTLNIVGLDRKVTLQVITTSLDDLIRRKMLTIFSNDLSSAEMSDIYSSLKDLSYILGSRKFQPSKYTLTVLEELSQMLINRYIRRDPIMKDNVLLGPPVISRDKRETSHLRPGEKFRSQYFKGRFAGNHRIRRSTGTDLYNRKLIKLQGRTTMTSSNNDTVYVSDLLTPISASQAKTLLRANDLLVNSERSYTFNVNSQILKDLPDFWMAICRGLIANGVPVVIHNDVLTLQTLKIEMDKLVIDRETNFTIEDTTNSQHRRRGKSQLQLILNENAFEKRPICDGTRDNCGTMCLGMVKFNDDPLVNGHSQSNYQMSDIFAIWPVLCDNLAEVNLLDSLIVRLVLSITIPTVPREKIPFLKCRGWDDSRRKWKTELCNTTAIILRDQQNDIEVVCTCQPLVFFGIYLDGTQAPKRWVTQSPPTKPSPTSAIYPLSRATLAGDSSNVTPTKPSNSPNRRPNLHAKQFVVYFKIGGSFNRITCNNVTTFIQTMRREFSYRFNVPPSTFAHFIVEPGSAQITMTVAPDPETTSEQEALKLMNTMQSMINDGTFCFTNQNNELVCAETDSYQLIQSDYKAHAKGSSIIGTIIGVVIAIVIGIVALCIIRTICKKKRKKKNSVGVEPLNKNPTYKQVNAAQVQPIDDANLLEGYIDSRPNYRMTMGKQIPGTKDSYRVNVKHGQPIDSEEQLIKPSYSKDSQVPNVVEEPKLPNQMNKHEPSKHASGQGPPTHVNGPGPSNELRLPNQAPPEMTHSSPNGHQSSKVNHAKSKE